MTATFGSLFSGIGGIDLGLERAGWRCAWQVERDPFCNRVLAKHWPAVPRFPDVCGVGAAQLAPVDLIAGGFPCQDISTAGKGAGLAGARSGLWSEYLRIVRELRPRLVLVENVPALRSRGLGTVLGQLAESGYDAEWDCIPAAALGAPHRRDRLFVVAYARGYQRDEPGRGGGTDGARAAEPADHGAAGAVADTDGPRCDAPGAPGASRSPRDEADGPGRLCSDVADADRARQLQPEGRVGEQRGRPGDGGEAMADPAGSGRQGPRPLVFGAGQSGPEPDPWWSAEPDVGRVAHGVPARVDRLRGLGNAVVPQVAEWIGRRLMEVHAARVEAAWRAAVGS